MKPKQIYYRRKGKSIIIEGKSNGKTILIWTLPSPEKFLASLMEKPSFFNEEKLSKIDEKLSRLDCKNGIRTKPLQEVRTINLMSNSEKDGKEDEINEELKELVGRA